MNECPHGRRWGDCSTCRNYYEGRDAPKREIPGAVADAAVEAAAKHCNRTNACTHIMGCSCQCLTCTPPILATGPTRPGYQHSPATYVEGREAPRLLRPVESMPCAIHGDVMMGCWVCARDALEGATDAATVAACARAAYETDHDGLVGEDAWPDTHELTKAHYARIARAVLAAAKGAGR